MGVAISGALTARQWNASGTNKLAWPLMTDFGTDGPTSVVQVGDACPAVLSQLGEIDLFIHDSLHSERNVRFEMDRAWAALRPGGAIVVDDIDVNRGFRSFTQSFSGYHSLICEAEPLRPDLKAFQQKGAIRNYSKGADHEMSTNRGSWFAKTGEPAPCVPASSATI